ncbi:hypothetical protein MCOR19_001112 [Pyricularia oryzae]|nr:hypothetical protein MCOR19_001112 [Pyricularia oryzae]KAI6413012.1 hypothetical protein MCOR20_003125 [Pyricularia oryzae]
MPSFGNRPGNSTPRDYANVALSKIVIFKIVQVLGLLAVGTSALPTPAGVDVDGGQLQARAEGDKVRPPSIKCLTCEQDGFPNVDEYEQHYKQKHPEIVQQVSSPNPHLNKAKKAN